MTKGQFDAIKAMLEQGESIEEIAEALGLLPSEVWEVADES